MDFDVFVLATVAFGLEQSSTITSMYCFISSGMYCRSTSSRFVAEVGNKALSGRLGVAL
jgi:hypothetical protein